VSGAGPVGHPDLTPLISRVASFRESLNVHIEVPGRAGSSVRRPPPVHCGHFTLLLVAGFAHAAVVEPQQRTVTGGGIAGLAAGTCRAAVRKACHDGRTAVHEVTRLAHDQLVVGGRRTGQVLTGERQCYGDAIPLAEPNRREGETLGGCPVHTVCVSAA
jgi:hypothetical protein